MNGFRIIGIDDEGKCECCGANCPKRRMLVETDSGVQSWGVICASKARGERGTATDVKHLAKFAAAVDSVRKAVAAGTDWRRANRDGFPTDVREGVIRMYRGLNSRQPDAMVSLA
jgi:hypothetical protein